MYEACYAEYAIDGNLQTAMYELCSHTFLAEDNFWQAQFSEYSVVRRIIFYFRSGCCKYF